MIRFQNTGNDTAFLVVIRDQLPPELDPAGVRPGAASHPYRFEMVGKDQLSFTFSNILLPIAPPTNLNRMALSISPFHKKEI